KERGDHPRADRTASASRRRSGAHRPAPLPRPLPRRDRRTPPGSRQDREVPPSHRGPAARDRAAPPGVRTRMNPSDRDRLLLGFLDGTASPSDRSHVEAMLAANAEWRSRRAELAGLLQQLTQVERALPPSDLRDRVLEGIRRVERGHRTMAGQKSRGSWLSWLMHLGPRPRVLVAASFALGLVLGTVAMGPA